MDDLRRNLSKKTTGRWWLVLLLFASGIIILLSSLYFLFLPVGYQGGRNPYYGIKVIFDRETWGSLHLWSGIAMIAVSLIHTFVHWKWIKVMLQRCVGQENCKIGRMNSRVRLNLILDAIAAISFILASASGFYLMFAPDRKEALLTGRFIFNYQVWDVMHTWSGIVMILAALAHLYIHWGWIKTVTNRLVFESKKATSITEINSNKKIKGVTNV